MMNSNKLELYFNTKIFSHYLQPELSFRAAVTGILFGLGSFTFYAGAVIIDSYLLMLQKGRSSIVSYEFIETTRGAQRINEWGFIVYWWACAVLILLLAIKKDPERPRLYESKVVWRILQLVLIGLSSLLMKPFYITGAVLFLCLSEAVAQKINIYVILFATVLLISFGAAAPVGGMVFATVKGFSLDIFYYDNDMAALLWWGYVLLGTGAVMFVLQWICANPKKKERLVL